jgi:hypothetical protein
MAREFLMQFAATVLTEGQELAFKFAIQPDSPNKAVKEHMLKIVVKSLEGAVIGQKIQKVCLILCLLRRFILDSVWSIESKCVNCVRQARRVCDQFCRII